MTFEQLKIDYTRLLASMKVHPSWEGAFDRAARACLRSKVRYQAIAYRTGVPWALIACLHWREISGSFDGVLHNGERIIGTGQRTRLEPAGRGPFNSWEEAAVDALRIKGLHKITDWSPERICYEAERFNGFGYRRYHPETLSPYLWSGTTHYRIGKYTSDHGYDRNFVDKQIGVVPLYQRILALDVQQTLPNVSRKSNFLVRVAQSVKAFFATVAGLFTLDTLGVFREWFSLTTLLDPKVQITLGLACLAIWIVVKTIERMTVEDVIEERYEPSGQSALDVSGPLQDTSPQPDLFQDSLR